MTKIRQHRAGRNPVWGSVLLLLAAVIGVVIFVSHNRADDIQWAPSGGKRPTIDTAPILPVPFASEAKPLVPLPAATIPVVPVELPGEVPSSTTLGGGWRPRIKGSKSSNVAPAQNLEPANIVVPPGVNQLPRRDALPALPGGIPAQIPNLESLPDPRELDAQEQAPQPKELKNDDKGQPSPDKNLLLGAARNAVKQGNFDQAIGRFDEYFKRFGDDPEVRKEYAGVLNQAGRTEEAIREYRQLVAKQPNDFALRTTLGDLHVTAKKYREAIGHYQDALNLKPDRLDVAVKLARAYVFDENYYQAACVYEQKLSKIKVDDDEIPAGLGALLVDLELLDQALDVLKAQRSDNPKDAEVLATLVRCYAALGDREKALETFDRLASLPRSKAIRQELADTLYSATEYELANHVYGQILKEDPANQFAMIGVARVHLELFQPKEACAVLKSFTPNEKAKRQYRLTWAEYHQRVGEYLDAKRIYRDFLDCNEYDHEVRLGLGALLEFIREDEKAKAEYCKIPLTATQSHKARLGIASTLTAQRFFLKAIDASKRLLLENPGDGAAMGQLIRTWSKAGECEKSASLARGFLETHGKYEPIARPARLAYAKAMLDCGRFQEAAHEYEILMCKHRGRLPQAYYGLARAYQRLNQPLKAETVLKAILSPIGGDNRARILFADFFYEDQDDHAAVEMASQVLKWDPDNLAALIRLADAQGRIDRAAGEIQGTVSAAEQILKQSPTNVRGHLAMARALGVKQDWKASVAAYNKLIPLDPDYFIPRRERARMMFSDNQFASAAMAYEEMLHPSADQKVCSDLGSLGLKNPSLKPILDPYAIANLNGAALEVELPRALATCMTPEIHDALNRIFIDYHARCVEQNIVRLEGEVKEKLYRPLEVIPLAKTLLDQEPTNSAGWFDLGQTYSRLRMTHLAIEQYSQEIKVDPQARESLIASERATLETNPQFFETFDYFQQSGRDGLALIDRTRYTTGVKLPYGDEEEFVSIAYSRLHLAPPGFNNLDGNIPWVRLQKKYCDGLLLAYGQFNWEDYANRIPDRLTFDVGLRYYFCDWLKMRGSVFRENVLENGESLIQGIYRSGLRLGADYQPTRRWVLTGTGMYYHYSDANDAGELYLTSEYFLTFPPKQLKFVVSTDVLSYRESTTFAFPNQSLGAIHPYFSPNNFIYTEARIEWYHWLSRDYFVHSNQCWYSLQYGLGFDNQFQNYNSFRGMLNFDVCSWLSIGADARGILSDVYKAASISGYLVLRSPWAWW